MTPSGGLGYVVRHGNQKLQSFKTNGNPCGITGHCLQTNNIEYEGMAVPRSRVWVGKREMFFDK